MFGTDMHCKGDVLSCMQNESLCLGVTDTANVIF